MQAYRAIEDFDAAWQSVARGAARPRLETVLQSIPQAERPVYLRELLAIELEYRSKRGESPSVRDYVQRLAADPQMIESVFAECGVESAGLPVTEAPEDDLLPADGKHGAPVEKPRAAKKDNYLSLKEGTEIGNYTIIRLIGQGGMGAVYQAEHRRMRRKVALKMISPDALEHPEALQRFHREAQAMARLEHPNIVTAHDADQAGDIHFLVMQYVDGEDLSTMVKTRGPLEVDMAIRYLMQTAMGLEYAHHEGVIHRDIKPSNLIVNKNGTVKILDMGLARLADSLSEASPEDRNLTQAGNLMGTVDYMAPEQALDAKAADERADIYSLGCTFYYTVTGQKLYGGDTPMKRIMAHRFEPIPSLHAARSDVPDGLDPIFQKMVAKNRADRYQSMTELLTALAPFGTSGPLSGAVGISSSETAEHSPGYQSYSEDLVQHRVAAVAPSRIVRAPQIAPDATSEKTSPSSVSDTVNKRHADEAPGVPAKKSSAHSVPSVSNRSGSIQPVIHEPIMQSENVSWRSRASSKDTGSHRRNPATSTRRRLLGAVAGYVGVLLVLGAAFFIVFGSDKGQAPDDNGTLVIDTADDEVKTAVGDAGIRVSNPETGDVVTLHLGSNPLKPGHYEIKNSSLPSGVNILPKKFHVEAGKTETLLATPADKNDNP